MIIKSFLFYPDFEYYFSNEWPVVQSNHALKGCSVRHFKLCIIFRPYFIWERKIFKSNGFFKKFAKN